MFVYVITNIINNKKYVGLTTSTLSSRWSRHITAAYKRHNNSYIGRSIRKYGKENFLIEILETAASFDELKLLEQTYIQKLDTYNNGYNLTHGGDGTLGRRASNETRNKIKESLKTRVFTEEWLIAIRASAKKRIGIRHTIEHKSKISISLKGRKKNYSCGRKAINVIQLSKSGEFIKNHDSYVAAAAEIGSDASTVRKCCLGIRKQVKNFVFIHKVQNDQQFVDYSSVG
jgi:group I intron endonuclease